LSQEEEEEEEENDDDDEQRETFQDKTLALIQSEYDVTRVYTPGLSFSAQRIPQETTPTTAHLPDAIWYIRGPPESP